MSNLLIEASLKNNDLMPLIETSDNCYEAVKLIAGDDTGAPVSVLRIIVKTESGKTVTVSIPNDRTGKASVRIDNEII